MSAVNFNQSAAMQHLANREQRQDARIQQGIQSGQLTPQEANRLQARHDRIDAAIQRQEAQPGGLTRQDFMRDMFRQDRASGGIWAQKHDGQQGAPPPAADPGQGADPTQGADPAQGTGTDPAAGGPLSALQSVVSQIQALVQQLTGSATT
ncbi:MAG TPA: hypothetical protein VFA20_17510 [Myxococcaceae bacterium]|nr:hypothetical protein [Myxococcaceae bacterium]